MGDRPLRLLSGKKWFRTVVMFATMAGLLAIPAAAAAAPHPGDADFSYTYNAETQQIGFWFGSDDADGMCVWSDSERRESTTEPTDALETQCFVVDVAGPNGEVNHGAVVSAFVHGLKDLVEIIGYEGPHGSFISEVAKGDDGKGNDERTSPPAVDSRGSKNKGIGSGNDPGVSDDDNDSGDLIVADETSDVDSDADGESAGGTDNGGGENGNSDGNGNGNGNGNGSSNGNGSGSSNANENAKGKGIGKGG